MPNYLDKWPEAKKRVDKEYQLLMEYVRANPDMFPNMLKDIDHSPWVKEIIALVAMSRFLESGAPKPNV